MGGAGRKVPAHLHTALWPVLGLPQEPPGDEQSLAFTLCGSCLALVSSIMDKPSNGSQHYQLTQEGVLALCQAKGWVLQACALSHLSSRHLCEVGSITIPILMMRKLKAREIKSRRQVGDLRYNQGMKSPLPHSNDHVCVKLRGFGPLRSKSQRLKSLGATLLPPCGSWSFSWDAPARGFQGVWVRVGVTLFCPWLPDSRPLSENSLPVRILKIKHNHHIRHRVRNWTDLDFSDAVGLLRIG